MCIITSVPAFSFESLYGDQFYLRTLAVIIVLVKDPLSIYSS